MLSKSIFTFLLFFSLSFAENITINNISSYSISSIHSNFIKTYTDQLDVFEYNDSTESNEYVRTDTLTISKPMVFVEFYVQDEAKELYTTKDECLRNIEILKKFLTRSIIVTDEFYIIKSNYSSHYYPKKDFVIRFSSLSRPLNSSDFCPDYMW